MGINDLTEKMTNVLWYTDGTDRQQWEGRREVSCRAELLEEDYGVLLGRVFDVAAGIRYFNLKNKPEGYWRDLFRYQPLAVLCEIGRIDVAERERGFMEWCKRESDRVIGRVKELAGYLEDWELRLAYYPHLQLTQDLRTRMRFPVPEGGEDAETVKKLFYGFLEIIRGLQAGYGRYLKEIRSSGKNDAGVALLDVFLQHYCGVVSRFNKRWAEWPDFYFRRILHSCCREIRPDSVWLSFTRMPGDGEVTVAEGTGFIAGKNGDGKPVCYRSVEGIRVENTGLAEVRSFYMEKDAERFPAARLGFVTAISEKVVDPEEQEPQLLFGDALHSRLQLGLMIESPMLVLGEGKRGVTVTFGLEEESRVFFRELTERIGEGKPEEISRKLLKDAFLLSVSTAEGWETVPDYVAVEKEGDLVVSFLLAKEFAPLVAAGNEGCGWCSEWPVLRLLMNPDAWLFPYSWMMKLRCERVKIRVEAEGLTALKVYGHIGQLDVSAPFYPFGVQPERGAQLVFGSYEMALKALKRVRLLCKWLQLPAGPEGFYGHYRGYERDIDNFSFRVRTEVLEGKKWKPSAGSPQVLFMPPAGKVLEAMGTVPEVSCLLWGMEGGIAGMNMKEEKYEYGTVNSGFFRMVLEQPDMGFGHAVYQQLFTEVMTANARRRRPLAVPALPVSPLLEGIEVSYEAEEELLFRAGQRPGRSRLFYLNPADVEGSGVVAADKPFHLAACLGESGHLLLGFTRMEGSDRIRFFVDVAAIQEEIDMRDEGVGMEVPVWSVRQGKSWVTLGADALVRDTTCGFISSGLVELLLPCRVPEDWLDRNGILWLSAEFHSDLIRKVAVKGFFLNVVEAVLDTATIGRETDWNGALPLGRITGAVKRIAGVAEIRQITPGRNGRQEEDEAALKGRLVHRIRHRNRAVTPEDYEDMVLEHFPEVAKVKCLPGLDTKDGRRRGVVTLVVVPPVSAGAGLPVCTHDLLLDIERFLQPLASSSVVIDAVNPLYEEITVKCGIMSEAGWSAGETVLRLRRRIDALIAPWRESGGLPVFGYRFGLQELCNRIMEDEGVAGLMGLSVLQVCREGKRLYRLNESEISGNTPEKIGASCVWGIPLPAAGHLIQTGEEWVRETGIGDIEVGRTLVVK